MFNHDMFKFCFVCGKALAMRYPGCGPGTADHGVGEQGNPEDGPRSMRCPDGHATVEELAESHRWDMLVTTLEEICSTETLPGEDPLPDEIQDAAKCLYEYYDPIMDEL